MPGSTVPVVGGTNGGGSNSAPQPKPIEQVQVGDKIMVPGNSLRQRVTSRTVNPDGSITLNYELDPDDDPAADGYSETQQAERLHDAYLDVQHKGAKYVKTGLEAYVELAKTPYYNLGGMAIGSLGSKALELGRLAAETSGIASRAGALAGKFRAAASRVRSLVQFGHTAEEVAQAERTAVELEQKATQLEAGAQELTEAAAHESQLSKSTAEQMIGDGNCFVAGTLVSQRNNIFVPIEQIKVGDLVLSRDPATKQIASKEVISVSSHKVKELYKLQLDNGEIIKNLRREQRSILR